MAFRLLTRYIKKEGKRREGEAESFFFAATIQTQFFERPSDQKRAGRGKREEGEVQVGRAGSVRARASMGSVGTHTEGHAAARGRSIQRDESG